MRSSTPFPTARRHDDGTASALPSEPLAHALEQRVMLDAALVATVVEGTEAAPPVPESAPEPVDAHESGLDADLVAALTTAAPAARTEVVFINAGMADAETLIAGAAGAGREVVVLETDRDGLQQIADYLDGRDPVDAIHIVAHGGQNEQRVGGTILTGTTINDHADTLARIGGSLTGEGDILLYGCSVAQGEAGRLLVDDIARITGADVAASTDATGAAAKGGDWVLEYTTGGVEAVAALGAEARDGYGYLLNTTLAAGDIAVLGLNSDDAYPSQRWAFVALADISAGATIHFTDASFDAMLSGNQFFVNLLNEGHMTWTVGSNVAAGTMFVVTNNNAGAATIADIGGTTYSGVSGSLGGSSAGFHSNGDQIFVYQGTAGTTVGAAFIYGLNTGQNSVSYPTEGMWMVPGAVTLGQLSSAPPGLADGVSAALLTSPSAAGSIVDGGAYGFDNMKYVGITSGTKEALLAAIGNAQNWVGDNVTTYDFATIGNFTITVPNAAPTITVPSVPTTVHEDSTGVDIGNFVIADTDGHSQTVTVTSVNGTATLGTIAGLGSLTGNGSGSISFSGSVADVNTALASLTFSPTANHTGAASVTVATDDGNGGTDSKVLNFTVNAGPTVSSIVRTGGAGALTNADSLQFDVTFSGAVTGVSTGDFAVTGTTATVTNVEAVSGSVYRVTVSGGNLASFTGAVGLTLVDDDSITAALGAPLGGVGTSGAGDGGFSG
ncbi:MAG: DUF4347 domain-containing protein, partial [Rhodospirillaceae bacterium]